LAQIFDALGVRKVKYLISKVYDIELL